MKGIKTTMKITVEVLSIDSIPSLLHSLSEKIRDEFPNGKLVADDGDSVEWNITQKNVEF